MWLAHVPVEGRAREKGEVAAERAAVVAVAAMASIRVAPQEDIVSFAVAESQVPSALEVPQNAKRTSNGRGQGC